MVEQYWTFRWEKGTSWYWEISSNKSLTIRMSPICSAALLNCLNRSLRVKKTAMLLVLAETSLKANFLTNQKKVR